LLPAPLRGHCVQLGAISSANHAQIQVISNRKKSLHLMKGVGVRSRDEAVPNHRYVYFLLAVCHFGLENSMLQDSASSLLKNHRSVRCGGPSTDNAPINPSRGSR